MYTIHKSISISLLVAIYVDCRYTVWKRKIESCKLHFDIKSRPKRRRNIKFKKTELGMQPYYYQGTTAPPHLLFWWTVIGGEHYHGEVMRIEQKEKEKTSSFNLTSCVGNRFNIVRLYYTYTTMQNQQQDIWASRGIIINSN